MEKPVEAHWIQPAGAPVCHIYSADVSCVIHVPQTLREKQIYKLPPCSDFHPVFQLRTET